MKGVLDRIENGKYAVILIEETDKEFVLPKDQLPTGSEVDSWFDLTIEEDAIISIQLDEDKKMRQQAKIDGHMNSIKSKSKGSKFKRR